VLKNKYPKNHYNKHRIHQKKNHGGNMHVTIVQVHVKSAFINAFIEATEKNHHQSIQENGNHRFDVLQSADDPSKFVLYEAYTSAEEAAAHKETAHYLTWRETVQDMMASPRQGIPYKGLFPVVS
jgi:autoinducer 2-degrading protein